MRSAPAPGRHDSRNSAHHSTRWTVSSKGRHVAQQPPIKRHHAPDRIGEPASRMPAVSSCGGAFWSWCSGDDYRYAVAIELVADRIRQRLERGVDDVGRHAHRRPARAPARPHFHHHARHGLRAAREDTHLVIDQREVLQDRRNSGRGPCAALRRARSPGRCRADIVVGLVADFHFDHRFGHRRQIAHGIVPALDHHAEAFDVEIIRAPAPARGARAARTRLRRRHRHSPGIRAASRLRAAARGGHPSHRYRCRRRRAARAGSSGPPGRTRECAAVADRSPAAHAHRCAGPSAPRRNAARPLCAKADGRHRRRAVGRAIEDFVEQPRGRRHARQLLARNARLELRA
jgi:hypothetical protein